MDRQTLHEEPFEGVPFDGAQGRHGNGSTNGNGHPAKPADDGATASQDRAGAETVDSGAEGIIPLSPAQLLAAKTLRSGGSLWQAAKAAGVSRLTLHEWRARHPEFSEVMERWEARKLTLARSRVAELAPLAANAMSDALAGADPRAAIGLLRSIQVLQGFGARKPQTGGQ